MIEARNRKIPEVKQVPGIPELDEADNDVAEHLFGWEQRLRLEMNVSDFVWLVPQNTLAGIDDIQGRKIIHADIGRPMVAFWSDQSAQMTLSVLHSRPNDGGIRNLADFHGAAEAADRRCEGR